MDCDRADSYVDTHLTKFRKKSDEGAEPDPVGEDDSMREYFEEAYADENEEDLSKEV